MFKLSSQITKCNIVHLLYHKNYAQEKIKDDQNVILPLFSRRITNIIQKTKLVNRKLQKYPLIYNIAQNNWKSKEIHLFDVTKYLKKTKGCVNINQK